MDYVSKLKRVCVCAVRKKLKLVYDTRNMSQYKLAIMYICSVLKKIAGRHSSDFFLHVSHQGKIRNPFLRNLLTISEHSKLIDSVNKQINVSVKDL